MKIYLTALGCKLNQCETATLTREFARAGYRVVADPAEAAIHVLNSCAVTQVAERKSRHLIHRLRRANPTAFIVATGCCGEIWAESRDSQAPNLIVCNADKEKLVQLVAALRPCESEVPGTFGSARHLICLTARARTRALVKIQEGCDNHCTYCIVRVLRGKSRSRPLNEILADMQTQLDAGYREIVLTGVNIGAYGRDLGNTNLARLTETILRETAVPRLRLSSIEPWDFTAEMLALWSDPRLCRHVHLPLQSGCNVTLARMGRRGTTADFAAMVDRVRAAVPAVAITTDIIAGSPGETAAEFTATTRFVEEMKFARAHIFRYSPRPGTPAATMPNQISVEEKRDRAAQLREITARDAARFRAQFISRTLTVLWETTIGIAEKRACYEKTGGAVWSGLTDNYIRVFAADCGDWRNRFTATRLIALTEKGMWGKIKYEDTNAGGIA